MRPALIAYAMTMVASTACSPVPTETTTEEARATAPATVFVTLPPGDPQAGRQAFLDLRCTACHAVPSEPDFPTPVSANPGPSIDANVGSREASYLLASIMTPSHVISADVSDSVRAHLEGVLSPMGDFSQVMTVRQLVDVHAYIRSMAVR